MTPPCAPWARFFRPSALARWAALLTVALLAAVPARPAAAADKHPPNVIILFADDLGYGDLGCYGHPTIRTPQLDRMAAEGMRFTQFYAAASICTPSRAALLTGRLPIRSGLNRVLNPKSAGGIPDGETTIAQALKAKGYATACVGKWHLGHLEKYRPLHHGFDRYYGLLYSNDMSPLGLYRDDKEIENPVRQATLTERYTAEALRFIKDCRGAGKPFFLYLPYTMPHVPLAVTRKVAGRSKRGLYGDVVETIDWSVGQVLKTLRDEGPAENTLVFFSSDNGPWLSQKQHGGSAGLLREGKGTTWEGGVREPCIAWWPGKVKAGVVSLAVASTMDFLPTCLELAGARPPADRTIDGESLLPVLRGKPAGRPRVLFMYWLTELTAVRKGPWKVHFKTMGEFGKDTEKHDPPLLFQLEQDPSENYNVARDHPDVIADIRKEVARHKAGLKAGKPQT
ncbi:MAG TPA: sulfatase [Gemmataceae bacterium]|nr:sulfatase [Gemmataceae bacterium]